MFEVVCLKVLTLEVSLEMLLPSWGGEGWGDGDKLKVGEDYLEEESLDFAKLVEPIAHKK